MNARLFLLNLHAQVLCEEHICRCRCIVYAFERAMVGDFERAARWHEGAQLWHCFAASSEARVVELCV